MKRSIFAALLLILASAGFWAFSSASLPENPKFQIPLEALRSEVSKVGHADSVTVHIVAKAALARFINTAWNGFGAEERVYTAFEVKAGGETVMIDVPHPERLHALVPGATDYFSARYPVLQQAVEASDRIVISHVHGDHLAGIPFGDDPAAWAAKTYLNAAQYTSLEAMGIPTEPNIREMGFPPELLSRTKRLVDTPWQFIAPGVAVIAAPGHTPGHQIIYINTGTHEFLLLGDEVWTMENIRLKRSRPRIISKYIVEEDVAAVVDILAAILKAKEANPELILLPSHDEAAVLAAAKSGALMLKHAAGE